MNTLIIFGTLLTLIFVFFIGTILWIKYQFRDYDDTLEKEHEEMNRWIEEQKKEQQNLGI